MKKIILIIFTVSLLSACANVTEKSTVLKEKITKGTSEKAIKIKKSATENAVKFKKTISKIFKKKD
tara:strand:- start:157 stop:354 length:198 start_codon:yes stop_codon:yes gene_type:complete